MTIDAHNLLEHQATALLVVDGALRVIYLNPSAEVLLAASRTRCLGEPLNNLLLGDTSFEHELHEALSSQRTFTRRVSQLQAIAAGHEITIDYTATPLSAAREPQLLIELQPLDRFLRINREANQLQLHRTTRELIRGLAHEVKNPLGGIRGAAQLLARTLPEPDQSEYTDIIIEEADRLRNLVDRLLGPNQLPHYQRSNIHRILERVRQLIDAEFRGQIEFVRDYDPSIPEFVFDPEQLTQALLNVVRNAAQALRDQQQRRILLRTRTLRQYTICNQRHRLVAQIQVIDNGPGIPDDMMERLFYPMISGRAEGSGLGLSITQSIMARHGGLIECDSRTGETRFNFLLPMESSDETA